jgi:thiamine-phosphate pyrophosphorylase
VSAGPAGAGSADQADEAGVQLILFVPEAVDLAVLARTLGSVPVAAVVATVPALGRLRPVLGAAGRALLALDGVGPAARGDADGVHLTSAEAAADARRRLGPDRLIGAEAGMSRHAAMVAGDEGADYVMFGAVDANEDLGRVVDLVTWWGELFVLPCAAAAPTAPDAAETLVRAGADFVAVGPSVWGQAAGGETVIHELARAIARAGNIGPT